MDVDAVGDVHWWFLESVIGRGLHRHIGAAGLSQGCGDEVLKWY